MPEATIASQINERLVESVLVTLERDISKSKDRIWRVKRYLRRIARSRGQDQFSRRISVAFDRLSRVEDSLDRSWELAKGKCLRSVKRAMKE